LGSETWTELAITAQFLWRSKCHIVRCATEVPIQVIQLVWIVNTTIPERLNLETMFLVLAR
jgi:RsiW-degrading membrane proteinase PrsW (M82 family)